MCVFFFQSLSLRDLRREECFESGFGSTDLFWERETERLVVDLLVALDAEFHVDLLARGDVEVQELLEASGGRAVSGVKE